MKLVKSVLGVFATVVLVGIAAMAGPDGVSLPGDVQIAAEIPEPATFLLASFGGVLWHRRRR